jgi:hypothetical protein
MAIYPFKPFLAPIWNWLSRPLIVTQIWVPFHCKFIGFDNYHCCAGHSFGSGSKGKKITLSDANSHTCMAIGEI